MDRSSARHVLALAAMLLLPALGRAQSDVIATVDTNMNATAELTECKRKEGVLTIKVRFKATAETTLSLPYKDTYVMDTAAGKKYEVLHDSEGNPLASTNTYYRDKVYVTIKAGESNKIWWKFPAPPAETKTITFSVPNSEPFEDVPITDAP
jgi:hypothetical protein